MYILIVLYFSIKIICTKAMYVAHVLEASW